MQNAFTITRRSACSWHAANVNDAVAPAGDYAISFSSSARNPTTYFRFWQSQLQVEFAHFDPFFGTAFINPSAVLGCQLEATDMPVHLWDLGLQQPSRLAIEYQS